MGLILFIAPIMLGLQNDIRGTRHSQFIFFRTLPFIVLFLISNFILLPKLLLKDRLWLFLLFSIISILTVLSFDAFLKEQFPELFGRSFRGRYRRMPPSGFHPRQINDFMGSFTIAILVVGFNTAVKVTLVWFESQRIAKEKEKEKISTELAFLKHQVSPHFFMNTLNNIHALIDVDTAKAQESVIKLAKLMRYLLYDTDRATAPLLKELEFIESFIDLMKIRYTESVSITFTTEIKNTTKEIPPLIFISFIENAFKHGISLKSDSYITISIKDEDEKLLLIVENSNHSKKENLEQSGIGLKNVEKRLKLLFNDDYSLKISNLDAVYRVELKLPS